MTSRSVRLYPDDANVELKFDLLSNETQPRRGIGHHKHVDHLIDQVLRHAPSSTFGVILSRNCSHYSQEHHLGPKALSLRFGNLAHNRTFAVHLPSIVKCSAYIFRKI